MMLYRRNHRRKCDEPSTPENNASSSKASTASASLALGTFVFSRSGPKPVDNLKIFIIVSVLY